MMVNRQIRFVLAHLHSTAREREEREEIVYIMRKQICQENKWHSFHSLHLSY